MVQEICRDIRKLDYAKTHLTHTITALRRLAMLVNAVGAPTQTRTFLVTHPVLSSLCELGLYTRETPEEHAGALLNTYTANTALLLL